MDSLLRVMAAKKREISTIRAEKASKNEKYLRRADVEGLLYQQQQQQQQQKTKAEDASSSTSTSPSAKKRRLEATTTGDSSSAAVAPTGGADAAPTAAVTLSWTDMKRRLRELQQPITLFGEDSDARMARLRRIEHDAASRREDGLGGGHDIRNEFVGHAADAGGGAGGGHDDDDDDIVVDGNNAKASRGDGHGGDGSDRGGTSTGTKAATGTKSEARGGGGCDGHASGEGDAEVADNDELDIYRFFKGMLQRWELELAERPDHIKRTAQGKMATKTMKQCKDYIRPLFKLCKRREVPADILPNLVEIVRFCRQGEFVQANDAYIKLAIGNAAWPIGVTMVGIHERTGREKINANKQAHVMNNEAQRKYITSVKRLISYAQSIANVLPSKKVS